MDSDRTKLTGFGEDEYEDDSDTESVCSTISDVSCSGGESSAKLYIGNLLPVLSKKDIQQHFTKHGFGDCVTNVIIFHDKATRKPKGYGCVTITPAHRAEEAIQKLNGSLVHNNYKIVVKPFQRKRKDSAKTEANPKRKPRSPKKQLKPQNPLPGTAQKNFPSGPSLSDLSQQDFGQDDSDSESVSSASGEFCKVYVGSNLPDFVHKGHIQEHFKAFQSDILNVQVIKDPQTKKTRGYAFITFSSQETAGKAIEQLNGSHLLGKFRLKVNFKKESRKASASQSLPLSLLQLQAPSSSALGSGPQSDALLLDDSDSSSASGEFCNVFVGSNFPSSVNKRHIQDHFKEFKSNIMNVRVVKDHQTDQTKYAFITFSSQAAAGKAIEKLNGSRLLGQCRIKVEFEKGSKKAHIPQLFPLPLLQPHPSSTVATSTTTAATGHFPLPLLQPHPSSTVATTAATLPLLQPHPSSTVATSTTTAATGHFVPCPSAALQPTTGPPQLQVVDTIIIENLSPAIDEDEIKAVLQVPVIQCTIENCGPSSKRATVRFCEASDVPAVVSKLDGKPFLGQTVHAFLAPLPQPSIHTFQGSQEQNYPESFSVKVTHLAPTVTEEKLQYHFQGAGEIVRCKIHPSGNRYAHVNFKYQQGAANAQIHLNGSMLDGWKINVSMQSSCSKHPQSPPSGLPAAPESVSSPYPQPSSPTEVGTVKVTNLPAGIQEKDIFVAFRHYGRIESIKVIPATPLYAYVNFSSLAEAEVASATLHETYWGSSLIRVQVHLQPGSTKPSATLSPVKQPQQLQQMFGPASAQPSGQVVQVLKPQPHQWNRLMCVGPHGSTVFQELSGPFKSNPNVQIQPVVEQQAIHFTGVHDAVWSAYNHFAATLNKELHMPDRIKMEALVEFYPHMAVEISQKYSISVSGYHRESSVIRFDGPPQSIESARREIDQIVSRSLTRELECNLPEQLLASVRKRLQKEGIQAYISLQSTQLSGPKLVLCSFAKNDFDRAFKVLSQKPCENYLPLPVQAVANQIMQHPSFTSVETNFTVATSIAEDKIIIHGFLLEDVKEARKELDKIVTELSVTKVPLSCSPEETAYLRLVLFQQPDSTVGSFLSSLPADVTQSKTKILLCGNPEAVQETQGRLLKGPHLSGLLYRTFSFDCNPKFCSQIEQYILKPFEYKGRDFTYQTEEVRKSGAKQQRRGSTKQDDAGFKIMLFTKDQVVFEEVCQQMEGIRPCFRRFGIHPSALECAEEITTDIERKCRVRLQPVTKAGSTAFIVYGLTLGEIDRCWQEIMEHVDSKLIIVKYIPVDVYQAKYLQAKHATEISGLRKECLELQFPSRRDLDQCKHEESLSIRFKGTPKQFEVIKENVGALTGTQFAIERCSITCPQKFLRMWLKRWNQVKKEEEAAYDLSMEFGTRDPSARMYRRSSSASEEGDTEVEVMFAIFGPDQEGVSELKERICSEESGQRVDERSIDLPQEAIVAVLKGLKQKELQLHEYAVELDINKKAGQITLTSPRGAADDLDTVEGEIQKFSGNRTIITKPVTSDDPVVGLLLNSKSRSFRYLADANSLAKPHKVSVRLLKKPRNGFLLSGTQGSIQVVEPMIHTHVLKAIQQSIGQVQVHVDPICAPLFSSPEFMRFNSKLQEEQSVVCVYPKTGKQSKLLRDVLLQPTSSAHCLKLEISKGNLVFEQVDAIVNAANEDLKHIGGLAQAILEAGGPSVQTESDEHVKLHGKLKVGNAVCLGAGNLSCNKLIHAVGPRWNGGRQNEEQSLYFTVYNVLCLADSEGIGSVALPAISTGVFAVPEEICAGASFKAVRDFCQANPTSNIHTVRFVLFLQSTVDAFLGSFDSGILEGCIQHRESTTMASATARPSSVSAHVWCWKDDHGSFSPYPSDVSALLSRQYLRNPQGAVICTIDGKRYDINLHTMIQTSAATGYQRQVQYNPASTAAITRNQSVQWYWMDDQGKFFPYGPSESRTIESMFQAKAPGQLNIGGKAYSFDFNRMCQINLATNYKRVVQRREESAPPPPPPAISPPSHRTIQPKEEIAQKELVVLLRGPKDSLPVAKTKLEEKLKVSIKTSTVPLPPAAPPILEDKLKNIAKRHDLIVSIEEQPQKGGKSRKVLKLQGLGFFIQRATSAIQEEIINYQISTGQESEVEYPNEWQPGQTQTTEVYNLNRDTPEWSNVEQRFRATVPGVQIVQISRIQNMWLWEKYVQERKRLNLKNDGGVNEKELFHGTRGNNPRQIYEGEDGFDMRFSAQGMWGQANYFAVNASYSNSYAHQASDGCKEMFLVRVLTGDSYNSPSDSSLRIPPVKQGGAGGGKVQFAAMRYDTVTGTTRGSQVYMTYDNSRAYPAYLIRYR